MSVRTWMIGRRLVMLVAIPIVCLALFWGFAIYLTAGDGLRLYHQGTLINKVAVPVENILNAMQDERRASMVYLAAPTAAHRDDLTQARKKVDDRIDTYRGDLADNDVSDVATDQILDLAHDELDRLKKLPTLRAKVDAGKISQSTLMERVTDMLDGVTLLYSTVTSFPDDRTAAEGRSLQTLAHARELRSRSDAILAGALAAGHFTTESYGMFVRAIGAQRFEYHEAYVAFTDQDKREYDKLMAKEPFPQLRQMADTAMREGGPGKTVPVDATTWHTDNASALKTLYDFELHLATFLEDHAKAPAYGIFARLGAATLLGAIAVLLSILVARRIGRALTRQLRGLRDTARDLAWVRLPRVVDRLRAGETVDVDAEVPKLPPGRDEIGQVSESFNEVGRTAVGAASEQAELRAGVSNVFLNIARRTQSLLHSQIGQLDVMERKADAPEALEDLFVVDHLATRMRRNAENLVILGGGTPGRTWQEPMPLLDVLRGAASEVEHYQRVRVLPFPPVMLAGSAVADVVHLTAELVDNAARFSPPHTKVRITGQSVPNGFAVEIEDRGLGMKPDQLAEANRWLTDAPEFDVLALTENSRLGMFVVARIASRHGVRVHLRESPYGGTTAIVLLPAELISDVAEPNRRDAEPATAERRADREPVGVGASGAPGGQEVGAADWPRLATVSRRDSGPASASDSRHDGDSGHDGDSRHDGAPRYDGGSRHSGSRTDAGARSATDGRAGVDARPAGVGLTRPVSPVPTPPPPAARRAASTGSTPAPHIGAHRASGDDGPERPTFGDPPAPPGRLPDRPRPTPAGRNARPAPQPRPAGDAGTHLGLPRRVRQASLAPGLRSGPPRPAPQRPEPAGPERSPEEIRRMMSSYQRGTARGRRPLTEIEGTTRSAQPAGASGAAAGPACPDDGNAPAPADRTAPLSTRTDGTAFSAADGAPGSAVADGAPGSAADGADPSPVADGDTASAPGDGTVGSAPAEPTFSSADDSTAPWDTTGTMAAGGTGAWPDLAGAAGRLGSPDAGRPGDAGSPGDADAGAPSSLLGRTEPGPAGGRLGAGGAGAAGDNDASPTHGGTSDDDGRSTSADEDARTTQAEPGRLPGDPPTRTTMELTAVEVTREEGR